jgi:hypothetical protein
MSDTMVSCTVRLSLRQDESAQSVDSGVRQVAIDSILTMRRMLYGNCHIPDETKVACLFEIYSRKISFAVNLFAGETFFEVWYEVNLVPQILLVPSKNRLSIAEGNARKFGDMTVKPHMRWPNFVVKLSMPLGAEAEFCG